MPSLFVIFASSTVAAVSSSFINQPSSSLFGGDVVPLLRALSVAGYTYWGMKLFQSARHPTLPLEPFKSKSFVRRLFLGHLPEMMDMETGGPFVNFRTMCKSIKTGGFYSVGFGSPRFFTFNPEDIHHMIHHHQELYTKGRGYELMTRFIGSGLLTLFDEEEHTRHRRIVGPAFSPKAMKSIANGAIPHQTQRFIDDLAKLTSEHPEGKVFIQKELERLTFNIITEAAFKTEDDRKENDHIQELFHTGMQAFSLTRINPLVESAQIGLNKQVAKAKKEVHRKVDSIVQRVRNTQGVEQSTRNETATSLIDYLVHAGGGGSLTSAEIADHSTTFLFAGSETTSAGLGFIAYLLARHPEVQAKLLEELEPALGLGHLCHLEDIVGCKYLRCVVKEGLRHYSPAPFVNRKAMCDDVLPGTKNFVAKDTVIMLSLSGMHLSKDLWGPDAHEFKPERWEEDGFDDKVAKYFLPFIAGKRNCIGKDLAMNELLMITASLVRNFSLRWPEGQSFPQPTLLITLKTVAPFELVLKKREE